MSNKYDFPDSPWWQYTDALEKLDKKYKAKKEILKQKLLEEQEKCPHKSITFHPDPSGNNDSYYECNRCGKEI